MHTGQKTSKLPRSYFQQGLTLLVALNLFSTLLVYNCVACYPSIKLFPLLPRRLPALVRVHNLSSQVRAFRLQRPTMAQSPAVAAARAYLATVDLSNYDPEQSRLMDERCILVDEQDNAIGAVDKKTCVSPNQSLVSNLPLKTNFAPYRPSYGKHQ